MAQLWLTVDAAADALGVSASTVRRRIKSDQLESRSNAQGVTEVLVESHGAEASDALNPGLELSARRRSDNSDDQLRSNPWIRAARPGDALLADRRRDEEQASQPSSEPATTSSENGSAGDPPDEAGEQDTARAADEAPPSEDAGEFEQLKASGRAFKPSDLEDETQSGGEAARFQKIAGAAVLLAQQQADDAREQVALARHEAYRLRRLCYMSWATTAAAAVLCFGLTLYLGYAASSEAARADAAEQLADRLHSERQTRTLSLTTPLNNAAGPGSTQPVTTDDRRTPRSDFDTNTTADVRRAPFE